MTPMEAALKAAKRAEQEQQASLSPATQLAHAGVSSSFPSFTNCSLSPPLHFSTTYTRPADGSYLTTDAIYSRLDNPTRVALEIEIYQLETAGLLVPEDPPLRSLAFASGMMAISSVILAHQSPLIVMIPNDTYHGVPVRSWSNVRMIVFKAYNLLVLTILFNVLFNTIPKSNEYNRRY